MSQLYEFLVHKARPDARLNDEDWRKLGKHSQMLNMFSMWESLNLSTFRSRLSRGNGALDSRRFVRDQFSCDEPRSSISPHVAMGYQVCYLFVQATNASKDSTLSKAAARSAAHVSEKMKFSAPDRFSGDSSYLCKSLRIIERKMIVRSNLHVSPQTVIIVCTVFLIDVMVEIMDAVRNEQYYLDGFHAFFGGMYRFSRWQHAIRSCNLCCYNARGLLATTPVSGTRSSKSQ